MKTYTEDELVERVLARDVRAAGRLMRRVDDDLPGARGALAELFAHTGGAHIIGVTGNPGSGKSTLVDQLIATLRERGRSVGCVAVDPTSPFSGGAILGDRVRMQRHSMDPGVFIRSVATRGNLGGISRSTPAIVHILDAMAFDVILIETVGVGQDEVDIVRLADTSVVVSVPGLGDDVQASKAGILEIADVFVINKADRPGVKRLRRELRTMIEMVEHHEDDWKPPVLETIAPRGEGVDALVDALDEHDGWLERQGQAEVIERERLDHYIGLIAQGELERRTARLMGQPTWEELRARVLAREQSPYEAADELLGLLGLGPE